MTIKQSGREAGDSHRLFWSFSLAADAAPDTRTSRFLSGLDLGPGLGEGEVIGRIDFVNSPCPGNDSRFVSVPDLLSLSLLQKRLNQIDGTVRIEFLEEV